MWAIKAGGGNGDHDDDGDDDRNNQDNEDGHFGPVLIYQPILGGGRRRYKPDTAVDGYTVTTYAGGGGGGGGGDKPVSLVCPSCHDPLFQLVQLHTPRANTLVTAKTLQVFACNRASCIRGLFPSNTTTTTATSNEKEEVVDAGGSGSSSSSSRNVLCYGGGDGVVLCRRLASVGEEVDPTTTTKNTNMTMKSLSNNANSTTTGNIFDDQNDNSQLLLLEKQHPPEQRQASRTNEWAADTANNDKFGLDDDESMVDLESKLAAMETITKAKTAPGSGRANNNNKKHNNKATTIQDGYTDDSMNCTPLNLHQFPYRELHSLREPPSLVVVSSEGDGDDDDVGIGNGRDDRKIQQMLQSYLAVEDDPEIRAALLQRGGGGRIGDNGSGGGGGERDERLSAADRALFTFTDRLKRSPRQVLRYAPGGVPLWSVPILKSAREQQPQKNETRPTKKKANPPPQQQQRRKHVPKMYGLEKPIPPCPLCGTPRIFELQLLPSLLHVLEVDKHVLPSSSSSSTEKRDSSCNSSSHDFESSSLALAFENGGMDWGNIAIYTCPNRSCTGPSEEYCVVQDSVDERPTMVRATPMGQRPQDNTVVAVGAIQPETMFVDDDDDEEEDNEEDGEGMIMDDDDDGSVW